MADYINDAKQLWHNVTGNSAESFSASPDFNDQLIHGFSQMVNGENPTSLLQAQAELMKRGWGPETSAKFLKEKIGILQQAQQFKEFNAVQKENAPVPAFMQSVTPSPAERDSMELGGFDPNQNQSLSKMMPGQPEKQMTPNQSARIAGPQAFGDLSKNATFLQVPQHQELLQASTANQMAQAERQKGLRRLEEMQQEQQQREQPLNDFATSKALGISPDEYEKLTGKPYPLRQAPQTLDTLGLGGNANAAEPTAAPTAANPNIGITRNAKGQTSIRVNPERQATGVQSRIFAEYEREQKALGRTATQIRDGWQAILRANAAATAGGSQQGALDVKTTQPYLQNQRDIATTRAEGTSAGSPLPPATQKDITGLEGALRQVDNIEKNYSEDFLGPIKGTDAAFELRRRAGGMINSPLGEPETIFRQSLKDVSDQLLRARSGAAINESEYKRLNAMLPQPTDEPQVFAAGLKRFKAEMSNMAARKAQLGRTPKGTESSGGQPQGDALEGKTAINPTTGEKLLRQNGQWVTAP